MMSIDKSIERADLDNNNEPPLDSPSQTNSKETIAEPDIQIPANPPPQRIQLTAVGNMHYHYRS
jgi:hypothetical protein